MNCIERRLQLLSSLYPRLNDTLYEMDNLILEKLLFYEENLSVPNPRLNLHLFLWTPSKDGSKENPLWTSTPSDINCSSLDLLLKYIH